MWLLLLCILFPPLLFVAVPAVLIGSLFYAITPATTPATDALERWRKECEVSRLRAQKENNSRLFEAVKALRLQSYNDEEFKKFEANHLPYYHDRKQIFFAYYNDKDEGFYDKDIKEVQSYYGAEFEALFTVPAPAPLQLLRQQHPEAVEILAESDAVPNKPR